MATGQRLVEDGTKTTDVAFQEAVTDVRNGTFHVSNETKLLLYALYKVATVSDRPDVPRPIAWDVVSARKWDAWDNVMRHYGTKWSTSNPPRSTREHARSEYVRIVAMSAQSGATTCRF